MAVLLVLVDKTAVDPRLSAAGPLTRLYSISLNPRQLEFMLRKNGRQLIMHHHEGFNIKLINA